MFVSTADRPVEDRAAFWRHTVSQAFGPLELQAEAREGFDGRIVGHTFGPVQMSDVRAVAHVVSRAGRHVLPGGPDHYKLSLLLRGSGVVEQAGRHVVVGPGDLVLYDLARPVRFALEAHHLLALTIPRSAIPLSPAHVASLSGTLLASRNGPGRLTVSFLTALAADGEAAEGPYGVHVGEALVNVVTGAIRERLDGAPRREARTRSCSSGSRSGSSGTCTGPACPRRPSPGPTTSRCASSTGSSRRRAPRWPRTYGHAAWITAAASWCRGPSGGPGERDRRALGVLRPDLLQPGVPPGVRGRAARLPGRPPGVRGRAG
nr:hypothetical protein GCM10020093_057950 [Planobispora longispora]